MKTNKNTYKHYIEEPTTADNSAYWSMGTPV